MANPYTFTGRRLDAVSGLMGYRNRHCHSGFGRFLSRDPAFSFDLCLYLYAAGRPTRGLDPSGLRCVECEGGNWRFSGSTVSGTLAIYSFARSTGVFECKQRKEVGYYQYCCGNWRFKQYIYYTPTAHGRITTHKCSIGLGGTVARTLGVVSGAPTSCDLEGWNWVGPGGSITLFILTGGVDSGGGDVGVSPGLGISISLVGQAGTKIYSAYDKVEYSALTPTDRKMLDGGAKCTKILHMYKTPKWVGNPAGLQVAPEH